MKRDDSRTSKRTPRAFEAIGLVLVVVLAGLSCGCKPPRIEGYRQSGAAPESAGAGASEAIDEESLVLATVAGSPITLAEIQRRLGLLSPLAQRRVDSESSRRQMLEAVIDLHLLAAEAEVDGYAADPLVEQYERAALREVVLNRLVRPTLPQPSDITDAEVQRAYDAERFRYQQPELVRVGLIVVPTRAEAASVVTAYRRRSDLDIHASMELFERLARAHSIAPAEAADLGFVSREALAEVASPEVVETVFGLLNAGQSADPIPIAGGQAIFYLIERRRALDQDISTVAESIREQIIDRQRREAVETTLERFRQEADISIDDELVRQLDAAAATQHEPVNRRPWEALSDAELHRELTPRRDLGFLSELLRSPSEPSPPEGVTDGDDGE